MDLSRKASETVKTLTAAANGAPKGKIAAVDPASGEYFVGDTVAEAVRGGRLRKSDPKAVFFVVRVGSPTRHALKTILVGGKVDQSGPFLPAAVRRGALILDSTGNLSMLVDTGFSGALALDGGLLTELGSDLVAEEDITLAGKMTARARLHLIKFGIRRGGTNDVSADVEAYELEGEKLLGMEAMAQVAPKLNVHFSDKTVALAD
ncbi:MAG: hypothetical protein HYT87_18335 [Nitrospirae bacterium]|nr:hypothetical protein [Nitrospirota bacterium]